MDSRTAAHTLTRIASFLELRGENKFKVRAYEQAAEALVGLDGDDLGQLDSTGTLATTRGLGPATLSVVRDLIATGESQYLAELQGEIPSGLLDLLQVPGLGTAKIRQLHQEIGVDSVDALEESARDGRLARVKGFGPKTVDRLLRGIELYRTSGSRSLYPRGAASAASLIAAVRNHPEVTRAEVAGSLRRLGETIGDVDIVAECRTSPLAIAESFTRAPGVKRVARGGTTSPGITYTDGAHLDLFCCAPEEFAVALWRATGSAEHVAAVAQRLAACGFTLVDNTVLDTSGKAVSVEDERALYALGGMAFIPPELRENTTEIGLAERNALPALVTATDIRGALHCHSTFSDGKSTIAEMAAAAREKGWSYVGITDHSEAAFFAGGMSRERVLEQHREIDALNEGVSDFRILKGLEADILADGQLDYDAALLDRFDFVVASVHSRFSMDEATMTARILRALDDPHLTVLGHPTGRKLLDRNPYAVDMNAVLEKAAYVGAAVELNADPHRLDLDWRLIPRATSLGVPIAIGPDAHSTKSLSYMDIGVGIARKGGLAAANVLNAWPLDDVLSFARNRREALG